MPMSNVARLPCSGDALSMATLRRDQQRRAVRGAAVGIRGKAAVEGDGGGVAAGHVMPAVGEDRSRAAAHS